MSDLISVKVDGVDVEVPKDFNVLQACEAAGAEVPRFCYHDRLSVAGNCRMCLVQLENERGMAPKPAASCATPLSPGLMIHTKTDAVQKARKGVMEFLLINHPLDCPICDQGGECDLQDQAMAYGMDRSRYTENKRAVTEKYMGPIVKTIMTRCIQCTRCVRFATEIAGVEEIGLVQRGEHAEISTLEKAIDSEMSGNLIDVCPVGALTSRPYAFSTRPWELRKTPTVDVFDAVGCNIRIDTRGKEVLRALPRLHEDVNEEWLADKSRYAVDGLKRQRLDKPYIRVDGKLKPASWNEAMELVIAKLKATTGDKIGAIAGDMVDAESMYAAKKLLTALGSSNLDCRQDGAKVGGDRASYLFNTGIAGLEDADAILLVGSNPRWEAPLINARIRKRFLEGGLQVFGLGVEHDLTYEVTWLGASPAKISDLGDTLAALKEAKNPVIIVGQQALTRKDGAAILAAAFDVAKQSDAGFNVLHTAASRVAGLDLGFLPTSGGKTAAEMAKGDLEVLFLMGADEIDATDTDAFTVYVGHHGDRGAHAADVILPAAAYTEKNATYVNTEGRVQFGRLANFPPGEAREDWTIFRAMAGTMGVELGFDNLVELRQHMVAEYPTFAISDTLPGLTPKSAGEAGPIDTADMTAFVENYYMTDPISRASKTMAECSSIFVEKTQEKAA